MENERMKILRWWAIIRWFIVVVLFSIGVLHMSFEDKMAQSIAFIGVFTGIVALNLLFQLQLGFRKAWMLVFQVVLDLVFATMVVHLTGGLSSYFVWVYLIGVITASLTIPKTGGVVTGLIGSLSLLFLIIMYRNHIVSPTSLTPFDVTGATVYILSYTGLFCGVAFIASRLSDQLNTSKTHQEEIDKLNDEINELKTSLEEARGLEGKFEDMLPLLRDVAHIDHDINTPLCVISLSLSRVKKIAQETGSEGLSKTNNEITESVNKISSILKKLEELKAHPLLGYKRGV